MPLESRTYNMRPLARPEPDSTLEGAFRVYMAAQDMRVEDLATGDFICIQSVSTGRRGIGIAWRAADSLASGHKSQGNPVIRVADLLRSSYSFELKDGYSITKWHGQLSTMDEIIITNQTTDAGARNKITCSREELEAWVTVGLASLEVIAVGGTLDVTPRLGTKKKNRQRLLVEKVLPASQDKDVIVPYQFSFGCKIVIRDMQTHNPILPIPPLEFDFGKLKGMDRELKRLAVTLNSQLPQQPILIVGLPGTGKTSVLEALSNGKWATFKIDQSTIISFGSKVKGFISKLFSEARETLPAVITIDDLDLMAPKDALSAFAGILSEEMRNSLNANIRIVASAKRRLDLNQCFTWNFPRGIELPIPTLAARKEILTAYCESASDELLDHVSERTHAFVPGDIWHLCSEARLAAEMRVNNNHAQSAGIHSADSLPKLRILEEDFEVALRSVHPSAMDEVFVEVPNVRWSDIGGSEYLKKRLQRAARFIFDASAKGPSIFKVKPAYGVLMYGPPGCSKTLMAKALATESKFNFFAVKGPELISKYVGDTEYRIREVFRKARAASPSIIFFDEFDAVAKPNTGHESLSPVTALRCELDGVEELTGVIVLAATNRPQSIDIALLRPGRFGKIIFVGPPDLQVRKQILDMNTKDRSLSEQVDTLMLAKRTEQWSGAEIVELCNIAAENAEKEHDEDLTRDKIMPHHFDAAFTEIRPRISDQMLRDLKSWTVSGVEKSIL